MCEVGVGCVWEVVSQQNRIAWEPSHVEGRTRSPRSEAEAPARLYPGHGPAVLHRALETVRELTRHRRAREAAVTECLRARAGGGGSALGPSEIVDEIYRDRRLTPSLRHAATGTVASHLVRLARQGVCVCVSGRGSNSRWRGAAASA